MVGTSSKGLRPVPKSSSGFSQLPRGALVIWERLDRVVTAGFTKQDSLDLIDGVERHLAMVFHRYLEGLRPRLRLTINGTPVRPWDPFLLHHPTTCSSPVERLGPPPRAIEVQCHVLSHKDHLGGATIADRDWKIDIRKSIARPPAALRARLSRLPGIGGAEGVPPRIPKITSPVVTVSWHQPETRRSWWTLTNLTIHVLLEMMRDLHL
jgi:hypothetical protein